MQSFAMTPNGKTIVGTGGSWRMGSLKANKLYIFDFDKSVEKTKPTDDPMP